MLGQLAEVVRHRVIADTELAQEGPVDDEVGVAADRRGEMAVGRAREPRVAEVARVVARLLERAQDEGRERLSPPPRLRDVLGNRVARLGGDAGRVRGREVLRRRRRRNRKVGELCKQQLDRLRVRPLVDAEERFASASGNLHETPARRPAAAKICRQRPTARSSCSLFMRERPLMFLR